MPTLAVRVTEIGSPKSIVQGILTMSPQVGKNCLIYLGGEQYLKICKIKGWLGLANGNYIILFDGEDKRFRIEAFASSKDFL